MTQSPWISDDPMDTETKALLAGQTFYMAGRTWQVPMGMTLQEAMGMVAEAQGITVDVGQDAPVGELGLTELNGGDGMTTDDDIQFDVMGGDVQSFGMAVGPFLGGGTMVLGGIKAGLQRVAPFLFGLFAAETLIPGETVPLVPGAGELANAGIKLREVIQDQLPGGLVPGERKTKELINAHLSSISGIQITAATQLPQGGWMGSYLPSPGARKHRGWYVGPGGTPVKTWANRGHAVISRDPRGSSLAKGARSLSKATSSFIKADTVGKRVSRRVKTKRRR